MIIIIIIINISIIKLLLALRHWLWRRANARKVRLDVFSLWKFYSFHFAWYLIIYMKKFLHSDWLRAVQFFFKVQKRVNSVQKEETNQAFWLVNNQRNSRMANQIFCFQIKRTPWMAQLMAQFFPDCVIRVRSICSTISECFHIYY